MALPKKVYKSIMASVAQILVILIVVPTTCRVLNLIIPDITQSFLKTTLEEIPIINVFTSYYSAASSVESLQSFSVFAFTVQALQDTILSSYIVGAFIYIFVKLGNLIEMSGIPAIQTLVGVFCSSVCLKLTGDDVTAQAICLVVLTIIAFVLAIITKKKGILRFLLDFGLGLGLAAITTGTISAYCTVLVLMVRGWFPDLATAINTLIWALIPALISLLIDYLIFGRKK